MKEILGDTMKIRKHFDFHFLKGVDTFFISDYNVKEEEVFYTIYFIDRNNCFIPQDRFVKIGDLESHCICCKVLLVEKVWSIS